MDVKLSSCKLSVCSTISLAVLFFSLTTGCAHDPKSVQVVDLSAPTAVSKGVHVVKKGDSLYSIAWMYDLDFKSLGAANNIYPPYIIYLGQRIDLSLKKITNSQKSSGKTVNSTRKKYGVAKKKTDVFFEKPIRDGLVTDWQWPVPGRVLKKFSLDGRVNKGIDIHGKLGEAVRAAATGKVVYAGNDVSGYGQLILLKHNNSYLSAYAHNKDLYVREGDLVKVNQKIAEIGFTGTTEPKLHFEIRRDGKPVDPLGYLPKR